MSERRKYWGPQPEGSSTKIITDPAWGDAGKGKLTDEAAQEADMVIRYNGGPNAGHTVANDQGEFKLHLVSSGIFNPDAICVTASGVVINPMTLVGEITQLRTAGVEITPENYLISEDTHLIMPYHIRRDGLKEKARGGESLGTTLRGIGPAYQDRTNREGLRMSDLLDPDFEEFLRRELGYQERLVRLMDGEALISEVDDRDVRWHEGSIDSLHKKIRDAKRNQYEDLDPEQLFERLMEAREVLAPMVTNVLPRIWEYEDFGRTILGEGAQGALLDLDLGGYPYVTSSNPGASGFSRATGLYNFDKVVGVIKAYTTRVGSGPMPTELHDEIGKRIREIGKEKGTTTGRDRRVGWFDVPAMKYGARIAGVDRLALTKVDIFDDFDQIGYCRGYEIDGVFYKNLPSIRPEVMARAKPVIRFVEGWNEPTTGLEDYNDAPAKLKVFVETIEEEMGLPIDIVSVGPHRSQTVYRDAA